MHRVRVLLGRRLHRSRHGLECRPSTREKQGLVSSTSMLLCNLNFIPGCPFLRRLLVRRHLAGAPLGRPWAAYDQWCRLLKCAPPAVCAARGWPPALRSSSTITICSRSISICSSPRSLNSKSKACCTLLRCSTPRPTHPDCRSQLLYPSSDGILTLAHSMAGRTSSKAYPRGIPVSLPEPPRATLPTLPVEALGALCSRLALRER